MYLFDVALTLADQIDHLWRRRVPELVAALLMSLDLSTKAVYVLQVPLVECEVRHTVTSR